MSTFRYKPDKIKYLTSINTLDTTHRKFVSEFETRRKKLNLLKTELNTYQEQLNELEKLNLQETNENDLNNIKKRSFLKSKIKDLERDIYDIDNNVSELEYYSNTNDILLDYYADSQILENENNNNNDTEHSDATDETTEETTNKSISKLEELNLLSQQKRKPKKTTRRRVRKADVKNTKSILDFFNGSTPAEPVKDIVQSEIKTATEIEKIVSNKATLFDNYMSIIDKTYINKNKRATIKTCTNCNIEKTLIQSEGSYVCKQCGEVEHVIVESEVPSHKEGACEKVHYPYKRLNHLCESVFWSYIFSSLLWRD